MNAKAVGSICLALVLSILPLHRTPIQVEARAPQAAPSVVERLNQAGATAHSVWLSLSAEEQATALKYLQPSFHQQGRSATLIAVTFVPAATEHESVRDPASTIHNVTPCCSYMALATTLSATAREQATPLTIDQHDVVPNTWATTNGLGARSVSTGVGFNVQAAHAVAYRYTVMMQPGTQWEIAAYNQFRHYDYEIWNNSGTTAGLGYARNFGGVYYYAFQFPNR